MEQGVTINPVMDVTLKLALEEIQTCELYTNKAFDGGTLARSVLDNHLKDKVKADREAIVKLISEGMSRQEAIGMFDTEDNFNQWKEEMTGQLRNAIPQ